MLASDRLRELPSVEDVAQRLSPHLQGIPRRLLIDEIRRAVDEARLSLRSGATGTVNVDQLVLARIRDLAQPSLRRVINATGVVLHTNLGRAPLPVTDTLNGYSNLEYDLATGKRGKRDVHLASLLERLTGKPGIAVNNNAAAVYLVLNELAAGHEVIVSRGQLIEIGDGFRIPDIMARAGVILREVGTTNRTTIDDFRNALTDRTRLLLIVHPSNFRIEGFTAQPERSQLATLAREHAIPLYEDLGSGCLIDLKPCGIDEPLVQESVSGGVNLVSFSGDKLLAGPQAGIICGDAELVARVRRNPMFRAMRLDKVMVQMLETALRHTLLQNYDALPALRMIRLAAGDIRVRSENVLRLVPNLDAEIVPGDSVIGGGSTPAQSLPTFCISIRTSNAASLERQLRSSLPPVIARVEDGRVLLDLRTVSPVEEPELIAALGALTVTAEDRKNA
jgi:L-seryl-tRNA(Ser) seleniumtransferase